MIKKKKNKISQYSDESINLKIKVLFILKVLFKMSILSPLVLSLSNYKTLDSNPIILPILIFTSLIFSIFSSKDNFKEDKYFLDDKVVISNKINKQGEKEDVCLSKFAIILFSSILFIIPFLFILSLSIGTIISIPLNLFVSEKMIVFIIKYALTLLIFSKVFKISNNILIENVKKMEIKKNY